jgi:hypothetical protein
VGEAPFSPRAAIAFDPEGRLVLGGTRKSRWFLQSGKDTIRTVVLSDVARPIAATVRDSVWGEYVKRLNHSFQSFDVVVRKDRIPATLPSWVSLDVAADGTWWIGRPGPNGELASWDLVKGQGIIASVAVPKSILNAHANIGYLYSLRGDVVALLHEGSSGVPWIGVYRLSK